MGAGRKKMTVRKGTKGLTKVVEDFEQSKSVGNKQYLPLGVWEKNGYDTRFIKEANDVRIDPVLGEVYGAVLVRPKLPSAKRPRKYRLLLSQLRNIRHTLDALYNQVDDLKSDLESMEHAEP